MAKTDERRHVRTSRRLVVALGWGGAGALLLWLVYLGFTWDLRQSSMDPKAEFRPVQVVRGDLRETVAATGTMESLTRVEIKSEVSGVVRKIDVEEGDHVAAGQPLVELDLDRLDDRVAELRAGVAVQEADARIDLVGRAAENLDRVRREHERVVRLFAQGLTSEQNRDDAAHTLALAGIDARDAEAVRAAREAGVLQARAALQKAERDLAHGILRAPIDGVVIDRPAELGSPVADMSASNGGTLVAVVVDDLNLRLKAQVDENDIGGVRVGEAADVHFDAFPGEVFNGTVRKVSSAGTLDQKVANFEVQIALPRDERIRVGMSADARIVVGEHHQVLLLPNTAIVRAENAQQVRRADGAGRFQLVPIQALYSDGFQTVIGNGVSEGETVLVRADGNAS